MSLFAPNAALSQRGVTRLPEERRLAGLVRKRTAIWAAGVALGIIVLVVSVAFMRSRGIDLWAWLARVWTLIAAIPLLFVVVACALKASEVLLNATAWTNVLRSAYPEQPIAFRQTLGAIQGGIGILSVIPPKFGGVPVLAVYRAAFPTLSLPAVLGTRVVQGVSSTIMGTIVLVLYGAANAGFGEQSGFLDGIVAYSRGHPLLTLALTAIVVAVVTIVARQSREWLRGLIAQVAMGGAILRTPGRYALLVVFPTLLALALRWGVTGTLLAAFGIPLSLETLLRVNVSHGLARSVQVTPGGFGTTQAFDLVALQGLAPVEVITAYSLSQAAILLVFNLAFALVTSIWAFGWERTARSLRLRGRSASSRTAPQPSAG